MFGAACPANSPGVSLVAGSIVASCTRALSVCLSVCPYLPVPACLSVCLSMSGSVDMRHRDGPCERPLGLPDSFWAHCGDPTSLVLSVTCELSRIISHGSGACVTGSMSVLTHPATYGILNSELTNCPRTAAVLGELAPQWQQMMASLQRRPTLLII